MLNIQNYIKVESLEEAYELNQKKNNKIIYIYRLNGATKTTCIFLLANVIFIIALISFVCGCIF